MNYPQTLKQAKTLLRQRHYAQAVQTAGSLLENLLVELYNELLGQSPPARQKELIDAQERVGSGQPLGKFTLGKLVGVYRVSQATKDIASTLGHDLTFLDVSALGPLVEIRNRAVHEGREPDAAEANYIVNQVELILSETGRLPKPTSQPTDQPTKPWWHTAIPHRDIREGRLNLNVFAVDLAKVLAGDAVAEYQDADTFFRRTYLTRGLRDTLRTVLRRLAGHDDGAAITQMATVFGGGKTHTLLALYHMVQHGAGVVDLDPVQQILREADLDAVPAAHVAAVDCAHKGIAQPHTTPEGITLHTLWGELAYRLGLPDRGPELYDIVRPADEDRVAPGSEVLDRLFRAAGPSLVLIDETLSYITKASAVRVGDGYLSDQAQEFLLELTRAVNSAADVALVLTMTSSEQEQFGEAAMRVARELDTAMRIMRRTRQAEVTAEREELYEILKRRLFDTPPAQMGPQGYATARAYWDYYRAHASDFPQDAQAPEYRDLMERAYPFHPTLIEILRDRWGTISGFQRTRGVLRLLALVIEDLYRHKHAAPLIQPAHVNLDNGEIRSELLDYVDNPEGYESAIFSDIGGTGESKAPLLDRRTGGDYARHSIATGLATAIFMYSHSGATQRPASAERPQLWLATLQPGVVPALAADALDKLRSRLFYLTVDEGTYRVSSQPNLNQMLVTRADAIRQEPELVREQLRETVEEVAGRRVFPKHIIWPEEPSQVDNSRTLTLVVLDPDHPWHLDANKRAATGAFIQDILTNARGTFRQFKNALVFVASTAEGVELMGNAAVRFLALDAIHRQYRRGGLSETQLEELETQLDQARKGLPAAVWGAYTVTVAPAGSVNGELTLWHYTEAGVSGYRPGENSLAQRAQDRLIDAQRLLERLDPRLIAEGKGDQWQVWPAEDDRLNVATLRDYFYRFPYLPMLTGDDALQQTIAWGVQRGLFAYALGDGETFDTIHFRESLSSDQFPIIEGAWLLRPTLAEVLFGAKEPEFTEEKKPEDKEPEKAVIERTGEAEKEAGITTPPASVYQRVTIDTPVNWRQWYDFYQAVIKPLAEAGADLDIQLHLTATGELDANLIDLSVKETILQLNAEGQVEVKE